MWRLSPPWLNIAAGITIPEVTNQLNPFSPWRLQSCVPSVAVQFRAGARTQGPPQPPIEAHTWTYLYAMPCALRINSNTDNGYERILYWRRIEYFSRVLRLRRNPTWLSRFPTHIEVSEGFWQRLNSEGSSLHSKVGGLRLHRRAAAGFLETVLWKGKSCQWPQRK